MYQNSPYKEYVKEFKEGTFGNISQNSDGSEPDTDNVDE